MNLKAAKRTVLSGAILASLFCSLSGGLRAPWDRLGAESNSAVHSTRNGARTYALINAQPAHADFHLSKPRVAKHLASTGSVAQQPSLLNASARRISFVENLAPRYLSQYGIPHTGRAPPVAFN
ncbi:MAG TPA: hypothetical protein VKB46_12250 [Pyrinomonadaceae bacterium]|nr:hypothetical protein [Pyrinomonadaceae bacterium]